MTKTNNLLSDIIKAKIITSTALSLVKSFKLPKYKRVEIGGVYKKVATEALSDALGELKLLEKHLNDK